MENAKEKMNFSCRYERISNYTESSKKNSVLSDLNSLYVVLYEKLEELSIPLGFVVYLGYKEEFLRLGKLECPLQIRDGSLDLISKMLNHEHQLLLLEMEKYS